MASEQISIRALPVRALELCAAVFLLSISFFMTVPLLAIYLATVVGTSTTRIGLILASLSVASQGFQLPVGLAANRWPRSRLLGVAALFTCLGYLGLALASRLPILAAAGFGLGLGNAITGLTLKTMMAEAAPTQRPAVFSLRSIAVNAGATLGPAVGALVFSSFRIALMLAGSIYVICWLRFRYDDSGYREATEVATRSTSLRTSLKELIRNRSLLALTLSSVGFWYLYTQFTLTVPLYADARFGLGGDVAFLFVAAAIAAIVLQYPVTRFLGSRVTGWYSLSLGLITLVVAFLVLAVTDVAWFLVVFAVVFALGEVMVVPTLDVVASELATEANMAATLGVVSLGWALGGLLGNALGAALYSNLAASGQLMAFWFMNAGVAALTAAAFMASRSVRYQPSLGRS